MSVSRSLQPPTRNGVRLQSPETVARHYAAHDDRWPSIAAALNELRLGKRRSVRIVDADCGPGTLLLRAVRHARSLGFTAIEGRGIDGVPALIDQARGAATTLDDPAIGLSFEMADALTALAEEADFPADIVLCDNRNGCRELAIVIAAAGRVVIDHPAIPDRSVTA